MPQNNFVARTARRNGQISFLELDAQGRLPVSLEGGAGSAPVAAFSPNEANAVATASLPAVAGETNSLSGFMITGAGATAAGLVQATITGLLGGTVTIPVAVPAGVDTSIAPVVVNFTSPLPASAPNQAITISLPALGAGNLAAAVGLWGSVG